MWQLKSRVYDSTLVRLAEFINRYNDSSLVSLADSTFYITSLPFYDDFKLITFIDLGFSPYLEVRLLDNGTQTYILDGTQNPFFKANTTSKLNLNYENVYQYALLVLGNIQKNDNSYRLVNSIEDICFSTKPTKEEYQRLVLSVKNPIIEKEEDLYKIKATILFDDKVIDALLTVSFCGCVSIIKEKVILNNMPIRELVLE